MWGQLSKYPGSPWQLEGEVGTVHPAPRRVASSPLGAGELWGAGLGRFGAPPPAPHSALGAASWPQPLENCLVEAEGLRPKGPRASQAGRQEAGVGLQHRGRREREAARQPKPQECAQLAQPAGAQCG